MEEFKIVLPMEPLTIGLWRPYIIEVGLVADDIKIESNKGYEKH